METCPVLYSMGESCSLFPDEMKCYFGDAILYKFKKDYSEEDETISHFKVISMCNEVEVVNKFIDEYLLNDENIEPDIDKKDVNLSKFKGKVLLIVNVASRCGLTSSNCTELSHLYDNFKTRGLEVLAFPCNQFGMQEPGLNEEIKQFACTKFKAEFPIFDKVDVNGPFTAPVYQFLKSSSGGFFGDLIKWNLEKFLVDKNGKVVERYPPTTSPFQIESYSNHQDNHNTVVLGIPSAESTLRETKAQF
ncbi:glutathione peroxidase [Trifolium repens]|nr:glutathione peroxidase [Trifolium repens]